MEPTDKSQIYEIPDPQRPASSSPTEIELEDESPAGRSAAEHDPYAALRHSNYRRYALGAILTYFGQQMQSVAVGWEVAMRSKDPALALSFVGLIGAIPVILLALPAGAMADQLNRKWLTVITVLLGAGCSFGLAVLSFHEGPLLYFFVLLGLAATFGALGGPARSAILPQVVPLEVFSNAATWNSSCFQISSVTGPALAGFLIGLSSVRFGQHKLPTLPLVYGIDAAFGIAYAGLLVSLTLRPIEQKKEPASVKTLLAGIDFVKKNQIILATISLDLFAVLLGGATYLLPIFATSILHVGAVGFGWLRAAPAIGALLMGLTIAHLPPMKKAGQTLLLAVAGFGIATIIFGLSHSFWLSLAMLFLTGAFDNISVVIRHTLVQVLTPDTMRGRVSAVNNVFIGASNELGGWESGLTANIFGPVWSVVGGGIGTLLVVGTAAILWPKMRQFGSLHDAKPIEEPAPTAA